MKPSPIRVLCVDDHALVREGITALVNRQTDMQVIAEATSGRDGIELFRIHRPDVALVDLRLPDIGGIEVIARMLEENPDARIIVSLPPKVTLTFIARCPLGRWDTC